MASHPHSHSTTGNIGAAFLLNLGFAIFELVGGLLTNSVAVLSDALHDLGDSLSLGIAWLLNRYADRSADSRFSYGYRRFSLLGALLNSVILVGGSLFVLSEAIQRLQNPEPFSEGGLIVIALIGIAVNTIAALRLREGGTLNARVLSWHLIEDVLGWAAVLVMGVISLFVDAPILDPLLSIGITVFVLFNAVRNVWATARVFMQAVPPEINLTDVEHKLVTVQGVQSVHNLRIWSLDGEHNVLSAHLVVSPQADGATLQRIKADSRAALADLHLDDSAIQLDFGDADCAAESENHEEREAHAHKP
jgi:cobalt-zinc-cadmium efflux system protein